jgi:phosphate transport system permease protein
MQSNISANAVKITIAEPRTTPALDLAHRRRFGESVIQLFLQACGALSILTTLGIVLVLGQEAISFFLRDEVTLWEFVSKIRWAPPINEFGIWPLVIATLTTSAIGMMVALPLGLMIAIYLSEYASPRTRSILKPILEVLAGVPTVVYGYFALTFVTYWLRQTFGVQTIEIYNTLSAGIVIGILILPLMTSMSEDALRAVPNALREAAFGLGATKLETAVTVVTPAALSGIAAGAIVAVSRAVGETMVVAIAAGAGPRNFDSWSQAWEGFALLDPTRAAETMTGHIVRISTGDLSYDTIDYDSLFAIGLLLFVITMGLNLLSRYIVRRFREVYD